MNLAMPSDLIEIPFITYFQYRNRGHLEDISISTPKLNKYFHYYKRDPRVFFKTKFPQKAIDIKWGNEKWNRPFYYSLGYFQTPYKPLTKIFPEIKYKPVHIVYLHHYKYRNVDKNSLENTALLFIHGYAENTFRFHEQSYFRLFKSAFDTEIFSLELPYHFQRQPTDSPFSGAYFLNGNPIRMLESIRQSIQEILLIIQYLTDRFDRVILFGISLGGHLAALSSQFLEDIYIITALASSFIFSLNPRIVPISKNIISELIRSKHTNWYKILYACNLKYFNTPFTTNLNTVIIGGRYDRIVPFSKVKMLSYLLERPLFAYPGGHLSLIFWLRSLLKQIEIVFIENS